MQIRARRIGRRQAMKKREILFILGLVAALVLLIPQGKKNVDGGSVVCINAIAATTTPTPTATLTPTATPTPTPKPSYLSADYKGGSVPIGQEIDTKQLTVTLYYDDSTTETIDSYDISGKKVTEVGENKFVIIHRGLTATFYVWGKKVIGVSASCSRFSYSVGNGPDERDLTVTLTYSDGSSELTDEYVVSPAVLTKQGSQELTVISKGQTTKLMLWGDEAKSMKSLSVSWDASYKPITDEVITKKCLSVIAVYSDYSTERVTSYELVTQRFANAGENELKVAYRGMTATTKIQVEAKVATDIRAEYKGAAVYVGEAPSRDDIEVYVKFNDGRELKVTDYTLRPEEIEYEGENKLRVTYDKLGTDIYVKGVAEPEPDFDHASSVDLDSDYGEFTVAVATPKRLGDDLLAVKTYKKSKVRKLMKKLGLTGDYIAIDIQFEDENNEAELPLPMQITVPEKFDIDCTYLFFSSNVRTQAARLSTEVDKKNKTIKPELFSKVGTYILVCDPLLDASADERDEALKGKE